MAKRKLKPVERDKSRGLPKLVNWESSSIGDWIKGDANHSPGLICDVRKYKCLDNDTANIEVIYEYKDSAYICSYINGVPIDKEDLCPSGLGRRDNALINLYRYFKTQNK